VSVALQEKFTHTYINPQNLVWRSGWTRESFGPSDINEG
jgi:hypothetical protein